MKNRYTDYIFLQCSINQDTLWWIYRIYHSARREERFATSISCDAYYTYVIWTNAVLYYNV